MQNKLATALCLVATLCLSFHSSAALVAYDLSNSSSLNLLSHNNLYEDYFSSASDGFQRYANGASGNVPEQLIDRSNSSSDSLGIIDENDTESFFGIVDTINNDNSDFVTTSWVFSIENAIQLSFGIDMAAMGDFESSDSFHWRYSIDNMPLSDLFSSAVDESGQQTYQLGNGNVSLNDPLSVDGQYLSTNFQSFTSDIAGSGKELTIELTAKFNGGNEVVAFKNLFISGDVQTVQAVSEPPLAGLFCLLSLMLLRKKNSLTNKG